MGEEGLAELHSHNWQVLPHINQAWRAQAGHLLVELQNDRLVGVVAVPLRQGVHIWALRKLRRHPLDLGVTPGQRILRQCEGGRGVINTAV